MESFKLYHRIHYFDSKVTQNTQFFLLTNDKSHGAMMECNEHGGNIPWMKGEPTAQQLKRAMEPHLSVLEEP